MKKIKEIVRLRLGHKASVRQIAASCGVGRSTVSDYLARIDASGLVWPAAESLGEDELAALLFGAPCHALRPLPDWNDVRRDLGRKGVTLKLVWEEYRQREPEAYSYSRFARIYRSWLKDGGLTMLQRHIAGERVFVDWSGMKLRLVDPLTGEVWEAAVFVAAMGLSQYIFAKAYVDEKSPSWLAGHVDALEFYGAVPQIVVPDNLKAGVDKACRYEPETNLAYAELAHYYQLAVLPTRVRKPKDKAKVENAVQQVERWVLAPLRERTFFSLDEANDALREGLERLNDKVMKGPGLSRKELYEQEDKPAMRPLPASRYTLAEWKRAKLGPDYHVEVEGHLYSVPFQLAQEQIDVRFNLATVEVFYRGKRVASHLRSLSRRGFTTLEEHMPERHKRKASWTPERMSRWATAIGANRAPLPRRFWPRKSTRSTPTARSLEL